MNAVDDFIDALPSFQKIVVKKLRSVILNCHPAIEEKIRYRIPFYDYKGMFCYLNPVKSGVDIGFCDGFKLSNEQGILEAKNRNTVKTITYIDLKSIDYQLINQILQEAILLKDLTKN